jgi:hypothetical protein
MAGEHCCISLSYLNVETPWTVVVAVLSSLAVSQVISEDGVPPAAYQSTDGPPFFFPVSFCGVTIINHLLQGSIDLIKLYRTSFIFFFWMS